MPYNPGVVDTSGQIRAQGMIQSSNMLANNFGGLMDRWTKDQEENKDLLAKSKATESFIKAHPEMFGGEDAVTRMTDINANETPKAKYARLAQFVDMGITGIKMEQAKAAIAASQQQTNAATAQLNQIGSIATRLNESNKVLASPDILKFIYLDPDKAASMAIERGADPKVVEQFIGPTQERRSREMIASDKAENMALKDALRAEQANRLKIPEGYRKTDAGNLEAIPGGPAALKESDVKGKQQVLADKSKAAKDFAVSSIDQTVSSIDEAIAMVDKHTVETGGVIGKLMGSYAPGTYAYTFDKKLETIKSNIATGTLQQMRALSQSGGSGFGQLNVKELDVVQSRLGSLDTGLSREELTKNLKSIKDSFLKMKESLSTSSGPSFEERLAAYDNPTA